VSTNNRAIVHCDLTYGGDKWRATPQNNAGTDANFTRYTANGSAIDLHTPSIGNSLRGQAVAEIVKPSTYLTQLETRFSSAQKTMETLLVQASPLLMEDI
jgi:hypothetical protein